MTTKKSTAKPKPQKKTPKPKPAAEPGKMTALDAAAKVLAETGMPMSCIELIDMMAANGYWTSPNGLTPSATLYAAMIREISVKGDQSRFKREGAGKFALREGANG